MVQWSALDILRFPLLLKFFVRIHRKNIQLRQKWAMLRLVLCRSDTQVRLLLLGHCCRNRLAQSGRVSFRVFCNSWSSWISWCRKFPCDFTLGLLVIRCAECLRNAAGVLQPSCRRVHKSLSVTVRNISENLFHEIHHSWLVQALCGGRLCVKKTPSLAHLYFV